MNTLQRAQPYILLYLHFWRDQPGRILYLCRAVRKFLKKPIIIIIISLRSSKTTSFAGKFTSINTGKYPHTHKHTYLELSH